MGVIFGTFALLFVGVPLGFIGLLTLHSTYMYFLSSNHFKPLFANRFKDIWLL